jgi:hypothetical protein
MCRPYIDTNNPQGMKLRRFKNRTPARFEYIYCTLFPLCKIVGLLLKKLSEDPIRKIWQ